MDNGSGHTFEQEVALLNLGAAAKAAWEAVDAIEASIARAERDNEGDDEFMGWLDAILGEGGWRRGEIRADVERQIKDALNARGEGLSRAGWLHSPAQLRVKNFPDFSAEISSEGRQSR
jgi:hypothetical protein